MLRRTSTAVAAALAATLLLTTIPAEATRNSTVDVTNPLPTTAIDKLISREKSKFITESSGVVVADGKTGEYLHTRNPLRGFMPASIMKVVTAVVALDTMGPNYRFKTTVKWDPSKATITLVGGGDPLLRSSQLRQLADKTAAAVGTSSAKLTLKVDSSRFGPFVIPPGWAKSQVPFEVRPVSALVVDDRKTKNPAQTAGDIFARYLRSAGLKVTFKGPGKATGDQVAKVTSYALTASIRRMLHESNNDIAEMLFRNSAVEDGGAGTWEGARAHAFETMQTLGAKMDNIKLVDGSGLSRANRLNAKALVALLQSALSPEHPELAPLATKDLLPEAGAEGTLKARFRYGRTACAKGLVEAKTGSLRDVISLAGYAKNQDGGLAVFSIVVNKIPRRSMETSVRGAIDWMVTALVGCTSPQA